MEERKKVIVVGAGAAGLMAAISAARAGAKVTVLESMERPGRKLLITGNGRCNLTNMDAQLPDSYYGSGAQMAAGIIRKFDAGAVREFFKEIGLLTQEKNGYVYPYSGQAVSVLEVLLAELRRLKVRLKLSEKIVEIRKQDGNWYACTETWQYDGDALILACGSCAAPMTGSDGSGYRISQNLSIRVIPAVPALVPVICSEAYLPALTGVRCRAAVSLLEEDHLIRTETGELQWTKYGVSGIVIFQLSRFISCADSGKTLSLEVDLVPDYSDRQLEKLLQVRAESAGEEKIGTLLCGILNEKLIPLVIELAGKALGYKKMERRQCSSLTADEIKMIVGVIKKIRLTVAGTKSFDMAQVCAGGIDAAEINPETLESISHAGLYFAGELVDVDGPCGGYNLQWAWSSGYLAGISAAESKA